MKDDDQYKEKLSLCLGFLEEAVFSLDEIKDEDHKLQDLFTELDEIYGKLVAIYER